MLKYLVSEFLTLVDIAAGTGVALSTLRRWAKAEGWMSVARQTGRRGRPALLYFVDDVLNSVRKHAHALA